MRLILLLVFIMIGFGMQAQESAQPPATTADKRIESFEQRQALQAASIVNEIEFKSVGPTVFSGRVDDVEVSPKDPSHFYVAYASGGLWKTENNGITFQPLFDEEMVMTIGDIAVDWDNNTIWVGTGEVNSSRSSYAGTGLFKSSDNGESWEYMGLGESHHIGRIIIHPSNPNIVWVAVLGHLYSPNIERGVYMTTDGGKNWEKTLYVNENAGAIDMVIDPSNPDILYAASWERTRRAWNFVESGQGSGIFKSTNGGKSWKSITNGKNGFPMDEGTGRIGLAIHQKDGKTTLYAALDNYNRRPKKEEEEKKDDLSRDDLRNITVEDFGKLGNDKLKTFLADNGFPRSYNASKVKRMVKSGKIKPTALVEYLENPNALTFDTPVIGLEVYRSDNEGKSWEKTHDEYINSVYSSYGYYFGQIRVAPYDENKIYILGVPVIRSDDGGKTFRSISGDNTHSDHHALWINPNRPGHLVLGNDGGINLSYDDGENWNKCNSPALGQFYYIAVDMAKPYNVYGGLQDNGAWFGPSTYRMGTGWHGSGNYPYQRIMGGDGMQVAIDTRDNTTVYTGFQFGAYFRLNTKTGERKYITPKHELGERPLRWNWQTPIHLSIHNQDIFYMGANKLYRSMNQADDFKAISDDLTNGGKKGDVAFGTLTTIHESPLKFGLLYTGSDDGLVHISKDGGNSWENITAGLPDNMWISRIQASSHDMGTVYVTLNGYRWDDFTPYVYKSTDYGSSWIAIGKDLPLEPVNVIKEDPDNSAILYVGTDHGLYVSINGGDNFMLMNNGLPAVPVHDVVIHPRDKDIVVGTHGRSIYIGRGKELQQLDEDLMDSEVHLFALDEMRASSRWGQSNAIWRKPQAPKMKIPVYAKAAGKIKVTIKHDDLVLNSMEVDCKQGLNFLPYDLSIEASAMKAYEAALNENRKRNQAEIKIKKATDGKIYLRKGDYTITIDKSGQSQEEKLTLK